jgi:hypothetical protein
VTQISNVGPGNIQLYQLLSASTTGQTDGATATTPDPTSAASDPLLSAATGSSSITTPLGDLRSQIETAVTDAVNNLGPSSTPTDLITAIQNAVQQTLKANGIDPQQFPGIQGHHHHRHAQGSQAAPQSTGGGDSDGDNDGSGTTTQQDPLLAALQGSTGASQTTSAASGDSSGDNAGSSQNTQPNEILLAALQTSGNGNGSSTSILALLVGGSSGQSNPSDPLGSTQAGGNGGSDLASLFEQLLGNANGQAGSSASPQATSNGSPDLTSVFAQLFAHFPNGSGLNTLA